MIKNQDYILTQNKMFRNVPSFQVPLDSLIHQPLFLKSNEINQNLCNFAPC